MPTVNIKKKKKRRPASADRATATRKKVKRSANTRSKKKVRRAASLNGQSNGRLGTNGAAPTKRRRATAKSMAADQRDISVSE